MLLLTGQHPFLVHGDRTINTIPLRVERPANLMRDFAKDFYYSQAWRSARKAYLSKQRGLCENCLKRGLYTPADTVHHIKHLTPQNINDPKITLSESNLMALCRDCHAEMHRGKKRYKVDEFGKVTALPC